MGNPVCSTSYNWLVTNKSQYGRKSAKKGKIPNPNSLLTAGLQFTHSALLHCVDASYHMPKWRYLVPIIYCA